LIEDIISFDVALRSISSWGSETVATSELVGRVFGEEIMALVIYPCYDPF
jgi:molybdopterin biosynthesis enzyme